MEEERSNIPIYVGLGVLVLIGALVLGVLIYKANLLDQTIHEAERTSSLEFSLE